MKLNRIRLVNEFILSNVNSISNDGLLNGKLGVSIYLFHFAEKFKDTSYYNVAIDILEQVYDNISNKVFQTDFENGLSGISWGTEYLIRNNFIEGNPDEMLPEIDDIIFKFLTKHAELSIDFKRGLLGYGFYLLSRLEGKDLNALSDRDIINKRLLIFVINMLYDAVEHNSELLREPITYSSTWNLPLLIIFLSKVRMLNIYNRKIDIILNRLTFIVLSTFPINYGNRYLLFISLSKIMQQVKIERWSRYTNLLKEGLEANKILKQFPNKNILMDNGLSGINLILKIYNSTVEKYEFEHLSDLITEKIVKSNFWEDLENKEKINPGNLGLLSGLAGVGISLIYDICLNEIR